MYSNERDQKQTAVFKKHGAFFAFGQKQFEEQRDPEVEKYCHLFAGLLAPKENCDQLMKDLDAVHEESKRKTRANHTVKELVMYELANHECHYTGSYEAALDALKALDITEDQVKEHWAEYWNNCVENDLF
jgi:hypothetical protein